MQKTSYILYYIKVWRNIWRNIQTAQEHHPELKFTLSVVDVKGPVEARSALFNGMLRQAQHDIPLLLTYLDSLIARDKQSFPFFILKKLKLASLFLVMEYLNRIFSDEWEFD